MSTMDQRAFQLRRPGPVTSGAIVIVVAAWLLFGVGVNWLQSSVLSALYTACLGSSSGLAEGQLWRLVTAPFLHSFDGNYGVWDLVFAVLGLLFFGGPMERAWGSARFARTSAWILLGSYGLQAAIAIALPASVAGAVLHRGIFFGTDPWVSALLVAWACHHWDQEMLLFGAIPATGRVLVYFPIAIGVLRVVAQAGPPQSGLLAPFFAMGLGWLLGGSTPSPLRRGWLRYRLGRLERAAAAEKARAKARSGLRVIEGGKRGPDDGMVH